MILKICLRVESHQLVQYHDEISFATEILTLLSWEISLLVKSRTYLLYLLNRLYWYCLALLTTHIAIPTPVQMYAIPMVYMDKTRKTLLRLFSIYF